MSGAVTFSFNSYNQANKYQQNNTAHSLPKTTSTPLALKNNTFKESSRAQDSFDSTYAGNPELKSLIKALNSQPAEDSGTYNFNKKFTATSKDKVNGFLQIAGAAADKELESIKSKPKYKYQQLAAKIVQAKNSISAGKALLSAKRSVREIRSKLSHCDKSESEEWQLALSHAKRMEMVARKKKHHLELEEMVERQSQADEKADEMESASQDVSSALAQKTEDEISEKEDAIFEERQQMMDDAMESIDEQGGEISDEAMADLNEMIAQFGEEELKQLEEAMEMMETLEVLDPHMSEEDLEELKRKHRASEMKAITKANADYLKGMIKQLEKNSSQGASAPTSQPMSIPQMSAAAVPAISVESGGPCLPSLDVSV